MRALALALSLFLLAAFLAPLSTGEDFGAVGKVNKLISVQEAPQLAPGESGRFVFYFISTYFLRFWLEFDGIVNGNATRFRMASPGFFTRAEWDRATSANATTPCTPPGCRGESGRGVNVSMLGVDGILPDSAFGVKEPIP